MPVIPDGKESDHEERLRSKQDQGHGEGAEAVRWFQGLQVHQADRLDEVA